MHLLVDVFGIAEPIASLADANSADIARPFIHVLEQMVMNGFVVIVVQIAGGNRFIGPDQEERQFELVEIGLVLDTQSVAENCRAGIAQRITFSGIDHHHQLTLFLAVCLFPNERPALIAVQSALTAFPENVAHPR